MPALEALGIVRARAAPVSHDRSAKAILCPESSSLIRWSPGERLHHLFEDRCDELARLGKAQHAAIQYPDATFTYDELDRRANRLARYLLAEGLQSDDIVGLLFDKSIHCYVSLLAVLKINVAYVPLDPGFPPVRVGYIVGDAGARAILTLSIYREQLRDLRTPLICLDLVESALEAQPDGRLGPDEAGMPESELCYIVYTSGSTGRPKGVPVKHASICNFVRVAAEVYGYCSDDRVYQGLTIAFDFSVEEIWVPLVAGATLIPNWTRSSLVGADLWSFLKSARVSGLCCVPTLLATIEEDLPDLRLLIVSGEACPQALVERWHGHGRTILNAYGPTETTVTATIAALQPDEPVTIGAPLPTYSVVILAPGKNRLLARGEIGEICIGGIGVAEGYLGREDLTRAAFIKDFLDLPNNPFRRIYRTGDLGAVNERDQIEYFGRIDTQVKIRGYRIELAEIDSVIMQLPQVAQAVVDTFEPEPGAIELVAYYTLIEGSDDPGPDAIARRLRTLLPSYMVPAFYERLAALPMLPSDKVDRKALPRPSARRPQMSSRAYAAPAGPVEDAIAGLLAELLKMEQVSVEDHFFDDLGASSLLMAQLGARIRRQLEMTNLSMREMYLYPTVRQLSAHLQSCPQRQRPLRRDRAKHVASDFDYYRCGLLQLLVFFGVTYMLWKVVFEAYGWALRAETDLVAYERAIVCSTAFLGVFAGLPIAAKWLLIGRWKEEEFPVWSLRYFRFWLVKSLIRLNPMVMFVGTPIYNAYLRALGAKVSWNALILAQSVPVCTDLLTVSDGAIVRRYCVFSGYRAESNRIKTGTVTLGRNTFVGDGTVLDIDTVMEDGSQLGHSSTLHAGQRLAAGRRYHGTPVQETETNYERLTRGRHPGIVRKLTYSLALLAVPLLVWGPLPVLVVHHFFGPEKDNLSEAARAIFRPQMATWIVAFDIVFYTSVIFLGFLLLGLAINLIVPRLLSRFIQPGKCYPLYGIHYYLYSVIFMTSNSVFFNRLFGDSSFIVYYLQALGYRCTDRIQTGSNFGLEQRHGMPSLCRFGDGTMVSDGLQVLNTDFSVATFRVTETTVGAASFLGNTMFYPSGARVGDNCLLATKVMVPIDGPLQENTGLLGSPCFTIPRSVRRDECFDANKDPGILRKRLKKKNASNLLTMLLFLTSDWFLFSLAGLVLHYVLFDLHVFSPYGFALSTMLMLVIAFGCLTLFERMVLRFRPLHPLLCSIYDEDYWRHERFWKLSLHEPIFLLNGTPFKNLVWRALGVHIGKKVFDDGAVIPERTLTTIGDFCTLDEGSVLQGHSLEDGIFKRDHLVIGEGCTIGAKAFVHYGVVMGPETALEPNAFLMKGERPMARSVWAGNPARELQTEQRFA
jgi:non-ribosomal peptide synthetase-like protein